MRRTLGRIASTALLSVGLNVAAVAQNAGPAEYVRAGQVQGTIRTWGSPQMGDLLKRYEAGFHKLQPSVRFEDDLKSTVTAVAGVYTGRADVGLLGREIWPTEAQAFESVAGHAPTVIDVATGSYDVPKATFALMVFVPKTNPLAMLSMDQLRRLFSESAEGAAIRRWGDLGVEGPMAERPIHLYGFTLENDKAQIFSQMVFHKGERWRCGLKEFGNAPGATGADAGELIVRAVAADPDGIGISNVHYATAGVKTLALSTGAHAAAIAASRESVGSRVYPLTRAVYMVVNRDAAHPLSAAAVEFLKYVLSRQGRDAVIEEGNYLPLSGDVAARQRRELGMEAK